MQDTNQSAYNQQQTLEQISSDDLQSKGKFNTIEKQTTLKLLTSSLTDMNHIYEIYVCFPKMFIKTVMINSRRPMSILWKVLPQLDYVFLYKGEIIDQSKSFEENLVFKNDVIVVMDKNGIIGNGGMKSSSNYLKWLHMTRDYDEFLDKVKMITNKKNRNEVNRLIDQQMIRERVRYEFGGSRQNQAHFDYFLGKNKIESGDLNRALNLYGTENIDRPSVDPLPIIF